jgi:excinuclease ABC subunit C
MTEVVALSRASGESRGPGLAEAPSAFRQSRDVALSAGRPSPLAGAEGAEGAAEAGPGEGGLRPGTGGADPGDDIPEEVASWEGISPDGALGLTDEGEDSIGAPDDLAKATSWGCPDLVLIDGGPGQLSAAHEVLDALGIGDIILVGIAKGPDRNAGREHFYMRGRRPFMLEPRDPVLYFVQRLRDEAHRFAIGTHRAKRAKAIAANPLDEIPGIGAKRRRALLKHFGSAKAISRAGVEDLQAVDGISAAMAQTIYDHFRGAGG